MRAHRGGSIELFFFACKEQIKHHAKGGRNPIKRFGESLDGLSQSVQGVFFADNFIDMMGEWLAPELRYPERLAG